MKKNLKFKKKIKFLKKFIKKVTFADELERIAAVAQVGRVIGAMVGHVPGGGGRTGGHVTALTGEGFGAVDGALFRAVGAARRVLFDGSVRRQRRVDGGARRQRVAGLGLQVFFGVHDHFGTVHRRRQVADQLLLVLQKHQMHLNQRFSTVFSSLLSVYSQYLSVMFLSHFNSMRIKLIFLNSINSVINLLD